MDLGYLVTIIPVLASDFGSAQRRHRTYIVAALSQQVDFASNIHYAISLCRLPRLPISALLYPNDHPIVSDWLDSFRAQPGPKRYCDSRRSWETLHQNFYRANGLPWPPVHSKRLAETLNQAKLRNSLTDREAGVLAYLLEHGVKGVVDLSQSLGRTPQSSAGAPCVMPGGILYSMEQQRLLVPPELLLLQGYRLEIPPGKYGWKELADLAGNAFSGHSVGAVLLAALSVLPP
jgi:hypothetical protein